MGINRLKETIIKEANDSIKKYLKESLGTVLGQDALIQFSEVGFNRIVERLRLLFYPKISATTKSDLFRDIAENSLGYNNILYLATVLAELDALESANLKEQSEAKGIQIVVTSKESLHQKLIHLLESVI